MPVFSHDELPVHSVPRIKTRVLVDSDGGAKETAVWEQWIDPEGYIPLHYHEVEEVLVILAGQVRLTLGEETRVAQAPVSVLIPVREVHGLRHLGRSQVHLLAFFPVANPVIFGPNGSLRPLPWQDTEGQS